MKNTIKVIMICLLTSGLWSCASMERNVIPEGPQDHAHKWSNTKVIGDYHASFDVEHNKGQMWLLVSNVVEEPLKIKAETLKAIMRLPDGSEKEIFFKPVTAESTSARSKNSKRKFGISSTYVFQGDWVKKAHQFDIVFNIPIKSDWYNVTFNYKTDDETNRHHQH